MPNRCKFFVFRGEVSKGRFSGLWLSTGPSRSNHPDSDGSFCVRLGLIKFVEKHIDIVIVL